MKCPVCGGIVYADDTLDNDWEHDRCYNKVEGTCPDCGRSWLWVEIYTLDHIEDIKPI